MPVVTSDPAALLLWALIGYGLGSIMFGVLLSRIMGLGALRKIGSGNVGATNVLRTGNKAAALGTLLFDGGKGAAAVLLTRVFAGEDAVQVAAVAAFLGHLFPVWLRFRGGKGVATFLGIMLAWAWPVGLAACATWLVTAAVSRYSSLSALMAAGFTPVWMALLGHGTGFVMGVLLAVLVYVRHAENIGRLRAGTESRIGRKS